MLYMYAQSVAQPSGRVRRRTQRTASTLRNKRLKERAQGRLVCRRTQCTASTLRNKRLTESAQGRLVRQRTQSTTSTLRNKRRTEHAQSRLVRWRTQRTASTLRNKRLKEHAQSRRRTESTSTSVAQQLKHLNRRCATNGPKGKCAEPTCPSVHPKHRDRVSQQMAQRASAQRQLARRHAQSKATAKRSRLACPLPDVAVLHMKWLTERAQRRLRIAQKMRFQIEQRAWGR
jgi:hypothetical protein